MPITSDAEKVLGAGVSKLPTSTAIACAYGPSSAAPKLDTRSLVVQLQVGSGSSRGRRTAPTVSSIGKPIPVHHVHGLGAKATWTDFTEPGLPAATQTDSAGHVTVTPAIGGALLAYLRGHLVKITISGTPDDLANAKEAARIVIAHLG